MVRNPKMSRRRWLPLIGVMLVALSACRSPGQWARLTKNNDALRRDNERMQRIVAQRDGTIARLHRQIEQLEGFGPGRPAGLFAPVKIEIASLSGGAEYDDKPGDDGVTVYIRPRDAEGDVVKVPGRFTIQLIDNTNLASPRRLGLYVFDDPGELGKLWHGKFATNHYTLRCPFPPGAKLPATRRVTVQAEFVDYLTGATLTAVKEVRLLFPK